MDESRMKNQALHALDSLGITRILAGATRLGMSPFPATRRFDC